MSMCDVIEYSIAIEVIRVHCIIIIILINDGMGIYVYESMK